MSKLSNIKTGYTFNDVLLIPKYSTINSREEDVDISTSLSDRAKSLLYKLKVPILSANMDTVTEDDMAIAIGEFGGVGVIHRFMSDSRLEEVLVKCRAKNVPKVISVGVNNTDQTIKFIDSLLCKNLIDAVCVDVAHGHHVKCISTTKEIASRWPSLDIIAGNVATSDGAMSLIDAGASIIKVGVGPGSVCRTRRNTGHGYPQLSAIDEIVGKINRSAFIIADGGIKSSGDIVKALAIGADAVMLGSMLAGTEECPGYKILENGGLYKNYRGMASFSTQKEKRPERTPRVEGISLNIQYKGHVRDVLGDIVAGVKSGLSYTGARKIKELQALSEFVLLTNNGVGKAIYEI